MSINLHSTTFDSQLRSSLSHLNNYPQMLPFIGNAWQDQENKLLFIAESHYLHPSKDGYSNSQTWYDGNASLLTDEEKGWTNTRGILKTADRYAIDKVKYAKGHSIFYNIKNAVFEALEVANKNQLLFHQFGFYNYFQRPAESSGKSIQLSGNDYRIAYNTLKVITEVTQPTALVFVSKKAHNSFCHWRNKEVDAIFKELPTFCVPHPASAWWNKSSKSYGDITGKARFINIIKAMDLKLTEHAA